MFQNPTEFDFMGRPLIVCKGWGERLIKSAASKFKAVVYTEVWMTALVKHWALSGDPQNWSQYHRSQLPRLHGFKISLFCDGIAALETFGSSANFIFSQ